MIKPDADMLEHEEKIVWERDPKSVAYVRESYVPCSRRKGRPSRGTLDLERFAELVGFSELSDSAPNENGVWYRRIFWLKRVDRDYDPDGRYKNNYPCEAVDPLTVSPSVPGKRTPRCLRPVVK